MKGVGLAAGIVSLIAGILELLLVAFIGVYALVFGMVAIGGMINGQNEDAVAGGIVVVVLVIFLLVFLAVALLHIVAAIGILRNKPNKRIMWAAAIGSVIPMCSFYCAVTSLPAGILLLITLLSDQPEGEVDPDILV